jgi:hypothetical protein
MSAMSARLIRAHGGVLSAPGFEILSWYGKEWGCLDPRTAQRFLLLDKLKERAVGARTFSPMFYMFKSHLLI